MLSGTFFYSLLICQAFPQESDLIKFNFFPEKKKHHFYDRVKRARLKTESFVPRLVLV